MREKGKEKSERIGGNKAFRSDFREGQEDEEQEKERRKDRHGKCWRAYP